MDDRGARSVWVTPPRTPRGRAGQTLTREDVGRVAVELADAEGISAVTMRSVAQRLGVTAMSLYWYVEARSQVIELMIDQVMRELPRPRGTDWRSVLRGVARGRRRMLDAHPWVLAVHDLPYRVPSPSQMDHYEQVMRALLRHRPGLTAVQLNVVISVIDHVCGGHAALAFPRGLAPLRDDGDVRAYLDAVVRDGRHPAMEGYAGQFDDFTADRFDDEIEVVLDGLASLFDAA